MRIAQGLSKRPLIETPAAAQKAWLKLVKSEIILKAENFELSEEEIRRVNGQWVEENGLEIVILDFEINLTETAGVIIDFGRFYTERDINPAEQYLGRKLIKS